MIRGLHCDSIFAGQPRLKSNRDALWNLKETGGIARKIWFFNWSEPCQKICCDAEQNSSDFTIKEKYSDKQHKTSPGSYLFQPNQPGSSCHLVVNQQLQTFQLMLRCCDIPWLSADKGWRFPLVVACMVESQRNPTLSGQTILMPKPPNKTKTPCPLLTSHQHHLQSKESCHSIQWILFIRNIARDLTNSRTACTW